MANIVLDDLTTSLRVGGGQWRKAPADRYVGGSAVWPQFAIDDTDKHGTLDFVFQGTLEYLSH